MFGWGICENDGAACFPYIHPHLPESSDLPWYKHIDHFFWLCYQYKFNICKNWLILDLVLVLHI